VTGVHTCALPIYQSGTFFGVNEMFTGVAIIFDTFRNSEHPFHKDVIALVNNGSYTVNEMIEKAAAVYKSNSNTACDASIRYHEKRDDFHALNKTTVRVKILNNVLSLDIDAKTSGTFQKCLTRTLDDLPDDFIKSAFIGVSSSTGHLADNHDLISIKVLSHQC
jgi:mannose-binding lectin 2